MNPRKHTTVNLTDQPWEPKETLFKVEWNKWPYPYQQKKAIIYSFPFQKVRQGQRGEI